MSKLDFSTYESPFSWRYGSDEMRQIFSEIHKRKMWRKIWVALARAQHKAGLLTKEEFEDLVKHSGKIDIEKAHDIEKEIYHDLMAEVKVFASQAKIGAGKIHLGATSMDIEDNADIIKFREGLQIIENKLKALLQIFAEQIRQHKSLVCMGYTHLQPAEPTTLGYRLSVYAQDLLNDLLLLNFLNNNLKAKGIKGAVGTSASYEKLLEGSKINASDLSSDVMKDLSLKEVPVSTQTYPRKTDLLIIFCLSSIAQSLHKFSFDLRIMQSPNFGEWSESRDSKRVGSSAMPFKRNPDKAEKVCSIAKFISSLVQVAWDNAANSLLERTLDDSANRRIFIPEAFLAADEILEVTSGLVKNLVIFEEKIKDNLDKYGPFAGTESLMMKAVKKGANRQEMHEVLREISMDAWSQMNKGKANPLIDLLQSNKKIVEYVNKEAVSGLIDPKNHTGLAEKRAELFLKELDKFIR